MLSSPKGPGWPGSGAAAEGWGLCLPAGTPRDAALRRTAQWGRWPRQDARCGGEEGEPEGPWSSRAAGVNTGEMQQATAGEANVHSSLQLKVTSWHKARPEGLIHCTQ